MNNSKVKKCNSELCLNNKVEDTVAKKLVIVIAICCGFMLLEIIGGFLANSLAIISDGFHLLTDLGGLIISLLSSYLARKLPTKSMNFGFRRIEILGAFISILFIWLLAGTLLFVAANRIINNDYEIETNMMILMASIGVFLNGTMAFILSYSNKSKCKETSVRKNSSFIPPKIIDSKISFSSRLSTSTSNSSKLDNKKDQTDEKITDCEKIDQMVSRNINIRAAFIHIIGDMIQSIGVLIASLIVYLKPSFKVADPICTIFFSIIVLSTTIPILIDIIYVLTESFPKKLDYTELNKALSSVNGILKVNDLKVWYLSTESYALNASLVIDPKMVNTNLINVYLVENLLSQCRNVLLQMANFEHINLQIDYGNEIDKICKDHLRRCSSN